MLPLVAPVFTGGLEPGVLTVVSSSVDKFEKPIFTSFALAIAVDVWEIATFPLEETLGKYWALYATELAKGAAPASIVIILVTLPYKVTELLYCFWSGPTSVKSLGILFILSLNNTVNAVLFVSLEGNKPLSIPPASAGIGVGKAVGSPTFPDWPG